MLLKLLVSWFILKFSVANLLARNSSVHSNSLNAHLHLKVEDSLKDFLPRPVATIPSSNLRGNAISLEGYDGPVRNGDSLEGFVAIVYFLDQECSKFGFKTFYRLQTCGPSLYYPDASGGYMKVNIYPDPETKTFYLQTDLYSDEECTTMTELGYKLFTFPHAQCHNNIIVAHFKNLQFPNDRFQYSVGATYSTQEQCRANMVSNNPKLLQALYFKNHGCWSIRPGASDRKMSCDDNGNLFVEKFSSTDGSCTGERVAHNVIQPTCDNKENGIAVLDLSFNSYANLICHDSYIA